MGTTSSIQTISSIPSSKPKAKPKVTIGKTNDGKHYCKKCGKCMGYLGISIYCDKCMGRWW